jgi:protein-disulfide isomerase
MGIPIVTAIAVLGLVKLSGCQQDNRRLDEISKDIKEIKQTVAALKASGGAVGAARGAAQRPQRPPGPDPSKVYAVPIGDNPYQGAENAKVTVVEAFEFA